MKVLTDDYRLINKHVFGEILRQGFVMPTIDAKTELPELASLISKAIADHISSSKFVRDYVTRLKKGVGQVCPDSPVDEIIKYLAEQSGQIDKSDAGLNLRFLDSLMFPIFDFEREAIFDLFSSNLNITDFEFELFANSIKLGKLVDELYYQWFKVIVVDYQMLKSEEKDDYEKSLKNQLDNFDYTVYVYSAASKKVFNRFPWALAFSEIIKEIGGAIEKLINTCDQFEEKELLDYFKALKTAYACRKFEDLENTWAEVDRTWIKIPNTCRMFPVHGMENIYEHPFGVSPEYRLTVRTDYGQEMISEIRNRVPVYAFNNQIDSDLVKLDKQKLSNLDMGVFTNFLRSGTAANSRSAGQVVPNRQDILKEGGKIFMDIDTANASVKRDINLLVKHCDAKTAEKLSSLIKVDNSLRHTIAHECTHPVGCTKEADDILGEAKGRLEEAKATIGGLAAILEEMSPKEKPEVVALSIARVCRFLTKTTFENPTMQAYVRENLVMANLLVASSIVSVNVNEKYLKIDLDEMHLQRWQLLMKQFYLDLVAAYHSKDPASSVVNLEKQYAFHSQDITNWMAIVNR